MKLLLDQNISFRIASRIQDIYPGTRQVKELGLENSKDLIIWEYARRNGFCILTFDNDFYDIGLLKGSPPKIIWLRTGNTKTNNIERILRKNHDTIKAFLTDPAYAGMGCLEINNLL